MVISRPLKKEETNPNNSLGKVMELSYIHLLQVIQFIWIAHFHKFEICLGVLYNLNT